MNEEAVILYSCLLMVRARGRERGAKGGEGRRRVERKMRSWHIYPVTNNESHYTVWTVWISVGVRVDSYFRILSPCKCVLIVSLSVPGCQYCFICACMAAKSWLELSLSS